MKERVKSKSFLSGSLLLAHPVLRDPNFRHSVILLSAHTDDGAMGIVLNRPTGQHLGEVNEAFAGGKLATVPVYKGGPVSTEQLILAAWMASSDEASFKLYFGIDPAKALELGAAGMELRAFLGYAGWTGGQLEGELRQNTWVVRPVGGEELLTNMSGRSMWRELLTDISPELRVLADEPENPEVN